MGEILIAGMAAMLICIFLGPRFIEYLRLKEFGQHIREDGPEEHHEKAGTPTMGGLIVFTAISIPYLVLSDRDVASLAVFGVALGCAALGFADDITKLAKRRSLGLSARWKLVFQFLLAAGLYYVASEEVGLDSVIELRIADAELDIPDWTYLLLIFLVIAGASNAVNLTDGLDGLAAGCCAIVLLAYTAITFVTNGQDDLSLLSACLVGRLRRLPLVQRVPGVHLHGGHGLARARRRDRRPRGDDPDRGAADHHRRHLRDRGALGRAPGLQLQGLPPPRPADGAGPPPLRAARVVGDEDHAALLDHRRGLQRHRLHAVPAVDRARSTATAYPEAQPEGWAGRWRTLSYVNSRHPRPPLPEGPFLVVGLARSGAAVARLLAARGERVLGVDSGTPDEAAGLGDSGVEVSLDVDGTELLDDVRTLVKSPGVPQDAPVVAAARERGIEVTGELELAWRLIRTPSARSPAPTARRRRPS